MKYLAAVYGFGKAEPILQELARRADRQSAALAARMHSSALLWSASKLVAASYLVKVLGHLVTRALQASHAHASLLTMSIIL
eukprot:6488735-Amphidinium_carterae.2